MSLSLSDVDDTFEAMNGISKLHEELLEKNRVKMRILTDYLVGKLEQIGHGGLWIWKYFPNEVMFEDLGDLQDSQLKEIHEIWDRYYSIILQKLV